MLKMRVPFTKNFYVKEVVINKDGNKYKDCIVIEEGDRIVIYKSGTIDLSKEWGKDWVETPIELIIVIAMRSIEIPLKYYNKIKVSKNKIISNNAKKYLGEYRLGDNHFLNFWYIFDGLIECEKLKDYYYVPYFPGLIINKEANIRSIYNIEHDKKTWIDSKGYVHFTYKRTPSKLHRALALTFYLYNDDPDNLQVNHKNGITYDNNLVNLEWCTPKENVNHAHGFLIPHKKIIVKDFFDDSEIIYRSVNYFARQANVAGGSIVRALRNPKMKLISDRYMVKYENDNRPFVYPNREDSDYAYCQKYIESYNIFTGKQETHFNIKNLFKYLNDPRITIPMLHNRLSKRCRDKWRNRALFGYLFKLKNDGRTFPELSDGEILFFRKLNELNLTGTGINPIFIYKNDVVIDVAINLSDLKEITTKKLGLSSLSMQKIFFNKGKNKNYFDKKGNKITFRKRCF